ncbi:MAG TPA: hypothetical protein VF695_01120 [Sphingomonas sp.]|jgi:hypothetical protein
MDQLDVNLSELRGALAERQRARTSDLTPNAPLVDDVGDDDMSMVFKTSAEQSAPASIEQEPARSWFQRLFGV